MDAVPFSEIKPHEVNTLLAAYRESSTVTTQKLEEVQFVSNSCRLVRLPESVITPEGHETSLVVALQGYIFETRYFQRLYLVEPQDVTLFQGVLCAIDGEAVLTAPVWILVQPLARLEVPEPVKPSKTALLGRLQNLNMLVRLLGLTS